MTRKILAVSIILLLALIVAPAAFAAPDGQDGGVDAVGEDTGDDDTGDDGTDDTGDDDTGDTDGDLINGQHPVVALIASQLGISYEEAWAIFRDGFTYDGVTYDGVVGLGRIMTAIKMQEQLTNLNWSWQEVLAWHLGDNGGWGSLKVADKLAADGAGDANEMLALHAEGCSWGHIRKGTCETDENSGLGKAKDKEKKKDKGEFVPPGQAKKSQDQDKDQDKDKDGSTEEHIPPGQAKNKGNKKDK